MSFFIASAISFLDVSEGGNLTGRRLATVCAVHDYLPSAIAAYFLVSYLIYGLLFQGQSAIADSVGFGSSRAWIFCCLILVMGTYVVDSSVLVYASLIKGWDLSPQHDPGYTLTLTAVWLFTILAYSESALPVPYPIYGCWLIFLLAEILLISLSFVPDISVDDAIGIFSIEIQIIRIFVLITLICLVCASASPTVRRVLLDEETAQPLLHQNRQRFGIMEGTRNYGSCSRDGSLMDDGPYNWRSDAEMLQKRSSLRDWQKILNLIWLLFSFYWPSGKPFLKLRFLGVAGCLIGDRILRVMIPLQLGLIMNALAQSSGNFPWKEIIVFGIFKILDSPAGFDFVRNFLWWPLETNALYNIGLTGFNKIMSLSRDFHDKKISARLVNCVQQAQSNYIIHCLAFECIPLVVDLALTASVAYYVFDRYMALLLATVSMLFVWSSTKILLKQKIALGSLVNTENQDTVFLDAVENWSTVAYFNRLHYEKLRYLSALDFHLHNRSKILVWEGLESAVQAVVFEAGLLTAGLLGAYQIFTGSRPIGSFITLLSLWVQLSSPLRVITIGIATIGKCLSETEEFFDLLAQQPTVTNKPGCKLLRVPHGMIVFSEVFFSYNNERPVLQHLELRVCPGKITALVGRAGAGKSTIFKLISRFYDPSSGVISIDGQDVSGVSLETLREHIGVIPQDPMIFNDTIMNNIRYGKLDASDDEIFEVCQALDLHESFLGFPDRYNTVVGEYGIRLSESELRRIAVARVILQKPKIILFDERTRTVESETEFIIRRGLKLLCVGCTMFIIAHRLSTLENADNIVVLDRGKIVEQGTHKELFARRGCYHRFCSLQKFCDKADKNLHSFSNYTDDNSENDESVDKYLRLSETSSYLETSSSSVDLITNPAQRTTVGSADVYSPLKATAPVFSPLNATAPDFYPSSSRHNEDKIPAPDFRRAHFEGMSPSDDDQFSVGRAAIGLWKEGTIVRRNISKSERFALSSRSSS